MEKKGGPYSWALLSFRRTFRQRYDDEDELIRDAREREKNLRPPLKFKNFLEIGVDSEFLVSRYLIIECRSRIKGKKRDSIIYFLPSPRMRDAAEATLHFVSSYDGFREINRKVR